MLKKHLQNEGAFYLLRICISYAFEIQFINMKKIILLLLFSISAYLSAQNNTSYWQQHVDYTMDVDIDVKTFKYVGIQKLVYTNNSPDVLN